MIIPFLYSLSTIVIPIIVMQDIEPVEDGGCIDKNMPDGIHGGGVGQIAQTVF